MSNTLFTDNHLAQLFAGLKSDFEAQQREGKPLEEIVYFLEERLCWSLEHGHLSKITDDREKQKIFDVLNIVIESMCDARSLPSRQKEALKEHNIKKPRVYSFENDHRRHAYCNRDDLFLTWLVLSSNNRPYYSSYLPSWIAAQPHSHDRAKDKTQRDSFAMLALILIAAALLSSAIILGFFAIRELTDCVDRIYHNEGVSRSLLSLSMMGLSGFIGGFIGSSTLSSSLTSLALAAGISPAGIITLATMALAMIGAGIVGVCFNQFKLLDGCAAQASKYLIDPNEPERFSLTKVQEDRLVNDMGLDILKVKCAMIAIRSEMNSAHIDDKMWRMFTTNGNRQEQLLQQLRDLKQGKYTIDVKIGNMHFDLRAPMAKLHEYASGPKPEYPDFSPSAPPPEPGDYTPSMVY